MGAQAVARDIKTMPQAADMVDHSPQLLLPRHEEVKIERQQFKMIPVLLASAAAASIAVFPFSANTSFAILWGEIGLFIVSVVLSVSRGPQGSKH